MSFWPRSADGSLVGPPSVMGGLDPAGSAPAGSQARGGGPGPPAATPPRAPTQPPQAEQPDHLAESGTGSPRARRRVVVSQPPRATRSRGDALRYGHFDDALERETVWERET